MGLSREAALRIKDKLICTNVLFLILLDLSEQLFHL